MIKVDSMFYANYHGDWDVPKTEEDYNGRVWFDRVLSIDLNYVESVAGAYIYLKMLSDESIMGSKMLRIMKPIAIL